MNPTVPQEIEAEFLRIPDAAKLSGMSRATIERLIRSGSLPSKCIRAKGAIKGIRLIGKQVLRDFINGCEDGGKEAQ